MKAMYIEGPKGIYSEMISTATKEDMSKSLSVPRAAPVSQPTTVDTDHYVNSSLSLRTNLRGPSHIHSRSATAFCNSHH